MNRLLVFLVAVAAAIVALVPASSAASSSSSDSQASSAWLQRAVFASTAETQAKAGRTSQVTGSLPTWRNLYDWPTSGQGYVGWHSSTTAPDDYGMQAALGGQYGLWLWPLGGHKTYDTKDYAQWTYTAPGTTRLESVQLSYEWPNKLLAHHCIDFGFLDGAGNVVTRQEACKPPPQSPLTITLTDPSSNPTSKVLYFRIHVDCGGASSCSKTIPSKDPLKNGAYARLLRADMTLVDDDDPVAWGSGAWFDLADDYTNGRSSYGLTLNASDAGSGMTRVWLEGTGTGEIASSPAPCDPTHHTESLDNRICPASYSADISVDSSLLPEGRNEFTVHATDVASNSGMSDPWSVYIDRTPPEAPASFTSDSYDPSTKEWIVSWDPGTDPDLPDGSAGSGVATSELRYSVNGGPFSAWETGEVAELTVPNAEIGDQVTLEVREVDAVGNESAPAEATLTLDETTAPPEAQQPLPENFCKDPSDANTCLFEDTTSGGQLVFAVGSSRSGSRQLLNAARASADPPSVTRSYYEHDANTSNLRSQGCDAAHSAARGLVILDFGRPGFNGGEYGAYTLRSPALFVSGTAIRKAAIAFAYGFVRCHGIRRGMDIVAIGGNNSCSDNDPHCHGTHQPPSFGEAGRQWNADVAALNKWRVATVTRKQSILVAAADDIEPSWEGESPTAEHTTVFNEAYNSAPFAAKMYDYGSNEQGYWSDGVRYRLAYGLPHNFEVPQIYLTNMAPLWQKTSEWGAKHGRYGKIVFSGILSQYSRGVSDPVFGANCGLSPSKGYNTLLHELNADPATAQPNMSFISNIVCHT